MVNSIDQIKLTDTENQQICNWVLENTGIVLDHSKQYLVENRLRPLIKAHKADSYLGLLNIARKGNAAVAREIVDCITTNETFFNRDEKPFNLLIHKLIPDLIEKSNSNPIRIWSAACSTGQEVYSIAIGLKKILFDLSKYSISILGTDISDAAITQASRAIYNGFEAKRGMPQEDLDRYFKSLGKDYQVLDEIRSIATFKQFNLLSHSLLRNDFQIVFCRNVAIYFSPKDKRLLFERIHQSMETNAKLIIGSTETLQNCSDLFSKCEFHSAVYYEKI